MTRMTDNSLLERLAAHKTIGSAPREELEWLIAHGSLRHMDVGEVLTPRNTPPEGLFILLSGHIMIFVDRGTGPQKVMEWRGGDVTGTLPYSRMGGPPGDTFVQEPAEVLVIHRDHFPELVRNCYEVSAILVHNMVDRARVFKSADLQLEKMASLGRLSAGLAHEMNNPVAAI